MSYVSPKYGRNPNDHLIKRFFHSASNIIKYDGEIVITLIDSSHYAGAFDFEGAAEFANLKIKATYKFKPSWYPGYQHENTLNDDSAIGGIHKFKILGHGPINEMKMASAIAILFKKKGEKRPFWPVRAL